MMTADDERFMRRALALAERGRRTARPNPVVGAVIVRRGRIIGEGFHMRAGEPHAEVNALAKLGGSAPGATMYVTLEPCCHVGRTGPCTQAVLAAKIARVVVGCGDPNPLVDGGGIQRLRRAGVRVDIGCLEHECQEAIRAYAIWIREKRPLVTLKAAATLDGAIADRVRRRGPGKDKVRRPIWITGPRAREAAHELRAAHDAVLVGAGTVLADDPRLTVRLPGKTRKTQKTGEGGAGAPLRVVLAGRRKLPPRAHVLDRSAESLVLRAGPGARGLRRALTTLAARGVQSLLVEGGATVHGAFIAAGLVDRVAFFFAPRLAGGGVPVAAGTGLPLERALPLGPLTVRTVGDDLLITGDVLQAKG